MADESSNDRNELENEGSTQVLVRPLPKTKTPPFYKVLMLNDDFTPRDFVVHVLQKFFRKDEAEATHLMLTIHNKGAAVAGVYSYEIAETKAYQCNDYSKKNNYPLKCTVEKV